MKLGKGEYPQIRFEVGTYLKEKVRQKLFKTRETTKEVGIRLFSKWLKEK